jgi:oxygen-dependent protoporphyrinogen oxidase
VENAAPPTVAIVGAGIAGLTAAYELRDSGASVIVLDGAARPGGKLAVSEVAGIAVDAGAEALLARRPEGLELIGAVGLAGDLVYPRTTSARIWSRGTMCALPRRQVMGVPADLEELAGTGLVSAAGMRRARQDLHAPATVRSGDVAVAAHVGARFGPEVVERLIDPLLAGVYAGRAEDLSFEATLPALARESVRHASLARAAQALLPPPRPASTQAAAPPVFTSLRHGLGSLPAAVALASGAQLRTCSMVRELVRTPAGWRLTVGSAHEPACLEADAVVLAVPAHPAARLLSGLHGLGSAAGALAGISYASMAIVTLAFPAAAFAHLPDFSGYLVPAADGRAVKAATFSSIKWPHLRAGTDMAVVRCSLGRIGEEAILQRDDADLAALAAADLRAATGVAGPPAEVRVSRWGGALPQYNVGHLDRVELIRAQVAAQPGLAVCGAAYDGLGIPACIASARAAAGQIRAHLAGRPPSVALGR